MGGREEPTWCVPRVINWSDQIIEIKVVVSRVGVILGRFTVHPRVHLRPGPEVGELNTEGSEVITSSGNVYDNEKLVDLVTKYDVKVEERVRLCNRDLTMPCFDALPN